MAKIPAFDKWENQQLADHEKWMARFLKQGKDELAKYPVGELSERKLSLLSRLEAAFRKRKCSPNINLLLGGMAEDDYRPEKVIQYINATDPTPRNYWQSIAPEWLYACEDCLSYLEPEAFCYLLPAYLRVTIERPYYLCTESIFFHLCYHPADKGRAQVAPLSTEEREIVTDIMNERRCHQLFVEEIFERDLLPWEYERYLSEGGDVDDKRALRTFAENLAVEYAERTGFLQESS